jgi:Spore Coat Protein U domain
MKKLLMVAALGAAGLAGTAANAATVNDTFDVDINLTAVCTVAVNTNPAFAYTSNQVAAQGVTGGTGTVSVTCTNGVPYTFSFIHTLTAVAPVFPVTDDAVNLAYSLTAPAGNTGNGAVQNTAITGNMAGGQAGSCGGGVCTNAAATNRNYQLVVTY